MIDRKIFCRSIKTIASNIFIVSSCLLSPDILSVMFNDLANSAGEATQMADIQQQSLEMQIQRVKNALLAPFLLSDKVGEAGGSLNEFTLRIKELVDEFTQFFIVIGPDGEETYSKHGQALKEFVIAVLNEAVGLIRQFKEVFLETTKGDGGFETLISLLHMATFPMKVMLKFLKIAVPGFMKWFAGWKLLTSLLPIKFNLSRNGFLILICCKFIFPEI